MAAETRNDAMKNYTIRLARTETREKLDEYGLRHTWQASGENMARAWNGFWASGDAPPCLLPKDFEIRITSDYRAIPSVCGA